MAHPESGQAQPSPLNQPSQPSPQAPPDLDGGDGGGAEHAGEEEQSFEENFRRFEGEDEGEPEGKKRPAPKDEPDAEGEEPKKRRIPTLTSQQLAALHKREQSLVSRESELSSREKAILERESILKRGKQSPFEALKALGYEDPKAFLEQIAQTGGEWTPEQQKIYELEQWKSQQEVREKERQEQLALQEQEQQYKNQVDAWHSHIAQKIKGTPQYAESLLAIPGTEAAVFKVLEDHYSQTGEQLEVEDACEQVVKAMEDEFSQALQTVAQNPRGRALVQELATKLAPQGERAPTKTASRRGLSPARNQTKPSPAEDEDLDTAVSKMSQWLSSQSR